MATSMGEEVEHTRQARTLPPPQATAPRTPRRRSRGHAPLALDTVLQVLGSQRGEGVAGSAEELADTVRELFLDNVYGLAVLGAPARAGGEVLPPEERPLPRFRVRITIEQLPGEQ